MLLGIYIGHGSTAYLLEYSQWLIPVAVVMGSWVILDVVLSLLAIRLTKAESDDKYKSHDNESGQRAEPE